MLNLDKILKARLFLVACLILNLSACAGKTNSDGEVHLPIQIKSSPSLGSPKAPVTIVEFTDFECPFCRKVQPTLMQIRKSYPDQVRLVFKNFPLSFHSHSRQAHLAALCADDQGKFWEYRNLLFANPKALKNSDLLNYAKTLGLASETFSNCLNQEEHAQKIDDDMKEAISLGVQGTPAFLINGRLLEGAQPFSSFQQVIDEELAQNKRQS